MFSQKLLGGPGGVGQHRILIKDVVSVRIRPLDQGDHMLSQKLFVNMDVDYIARGNGNVTLTQSPAVTKTMRRFWGGYPTLPAPSAQRSFGE
jgi:hypothetical protein